MIFLINWLLSTDIFYDIYIFFIVFLETKIFKIYRCFLTMMLFNKTFVNILKTQVLYHISTHTNS